MTTTYSKLSGLLLLLSLPFLASACEGECITGCTNAFVDKFIGSKGVLTTVIKNADCELQACHRGTPGPCSEMRYFQPIFDCVKEQSFDRTRDDVFPGHFHGKCQIDGVNPEGCPNPDCPVLCGTPGSMVHFYDSDLVPIVNNAFSSILATCTQPSSDAYKQSKELFEQDSQHRPVRFARRGLPLAGLLGGIGGGKSASSGSPLSGSPKMSGSSGLGGLLGRDSPSPRGGLLDGLLGGLSPSSSSSLTTKQSSCDVSEVMTSLPRLFQAACADGGSEFGNCRWKDELTKFILQYP